MLVERIQKEEDGGVGKESKGKGREGALKPSLNGKKGMFSELWLRESLCCSLIQQLA